MGNKNLSFILSLFFFLACFNAYSSCNTKDAEIDTTYHICKVVKIRHVENAYILDLHDEKNDTWYTLVTVARKGREKKCSKIKVGKSYKLLLNPYYKQDRTPCLGLNFIVVIDAKKIIVPSSSWTGNVYTSSNLKGLYYIAPRRQ